MELLATRRVPRRRMKASSIVIITGNATQPPLVKPCHLEYGLWRLDHGASLVFGCPDPPLFCAMMASLSVQGDWH